MTDLDRARKWLEKQTTAVADKVWDDQNWEASSLAAEFAACRREAMESAARIAEVFDGPFDAGVNRESEWAGGSHFASIRIASAIRAAATEGMR